MSINTCIFIFTRDLRIEDNTGLNNCIENYDVVIPLFIITETQVSNKNDYKSVSALSFMKKSLQNLYKETDGKLNIYHTKKADYESILDKLVSKYNVDSIQINRDYSPFAVKREEDIKTLCKKNKIHYESHHDHLLVQDFVFSSSGSYYKKFTPFYNKAIKKTIHQPKTTKNIIKKMKQVKKDSLSSLKYLKSQSIEIPYDIDLEALKDVISKNKNNGFVDDYGDVKYELEEERSRLSVYLKFGVISVRQIYYITRKHKNFSRSLFWRDFYYTYYYHSPKALYEGDGWANVIKKWSNNKDHLESWKQGKTGFPIIDAGMRQLNQIGFMPNRNRMLVASFLTKLLLIDWREGEKYFSNKLLDIDWVINNANWQNEVSVAVHSQPYFRVKNPWIQTRDYDADCKYIKKWIPELENVKNEDILDWDKEYKKYTSKIDYLKPIIDYDEAKNKYIQKIKNEK